MAAEKMNAYSVADDLTDAVLIVEEQELHVIKALLSMQSPVFKAMFEGNFKERQDSRVSLPEKKLTEIEWMLDYFYPNTNFTVTDEMATKLLPLADEYQIDGLKTKCIDVLMKQQNPRLEIITLADKYGLSSLLETALNHCAATLPLSDEPRVYARQYYKTELLPRYAEKKEQNSYIDNKTTGFGRSVGLFGSYPAQTLLSTNTRTRQGRDNYSVYENLNSSIDSELKETQNDGLSKDILLCLYRKKIEFAKTKLEEAGIKCRWL
ncbi:kelch-like protein 2 [Watersipora subatra]|uniref:kelch-like protein 2 n=1 Tax=Watersipora subatra TaxID=2589382 RepID=UPI00355C86F7